MTGNSEEDGIHERMMARRNIVTELRAASAIAVKQWRVEFAYPLTVLWFVLLPVMWMLPYFITGVALTGAMQSPALEASVGTSDWVSYVSIGTAYMGLTLSMIWGTGHALRREQNVGTLETLMAMPVRRGTLVWGSMLHELQHGGLGVVLQLVASVFLFGVSLNAWGVLPALAIVALSVIGLQGIAFAVACIVLVAKRGWMLTEVLGDIMILVAPMAYPIAVLPPVLQYISVASPLTWSVEGFRGCLMYGLAYEGLLRAVMALVILDTVYLTIGVLMFMATERWVRKRGALAQF